MTSSSDRRPRVFISYTHDSPAHKKRVRELTDRLVTEGGLDCHLDDYEQNPPLGWPVWMNEQVREADFVLLVCTETYARRVEGREAPGRGAGASWEGAFITQGVYENNGRNDKFIPVILSAENGTHVPEFLRRYSYYDLSQSARYNELVQRLHGVNLKARPPLGPKPTFGTVAMTAEQLPARPHSPNVQLRREVTDLDRDKFLRGCFDFMSNYFQHSLERLAEDNPGIETDFMRVDANRFQAGVYRDGREVAKCTIWLGDRSSLAAGIAYTGGYTTATNSFNETLSVAADDSNLFLKALSAGIGFHQVAERLNRDDAAEYYWSRLTAPLR